MNQDPDGSEPWTGRCSPDVPFRHDPGVWAIASAIDQVSVLRNKVLDEQACHAAVDH